MMSALHWICALTLTLTILCCLSAQPVERDVKSAEIQYNLNKLRNFIKNHDCIKDLTLYSPTNDYCLYPALNCTLLELKTLKHECPNLNKDDYDDEASESLLNLETLLLAKLNSTHPSPEHSCTACEAYKETDVLQFLNNIENLIQKLNSSKN